MRTSESGTTDLFCRLCIFSPLLLLPVSARVPLLLFFLMLTESAAAAAFCACSPPDFSACAGFLVREGSPFEISRTCPRPRRGKTPAQGCRLSLLKDDFPQSPGTRRLSARPLKRQNRKRGLHFHKGYEADIARLGGFPAGMPLPTPQEIDRLPLEDQRIIRNLMGGGQGLEMENSRKEASAASRGLLARADDNMLGREMRDGEGGDATSSNVLGKKEKKKKKSGLASLMKQVEPETALAPSALREKLKQKKEKLKKEKEKDSGEKETGGLQGRETIAKGTSRKKPSQGDQMIAVMKEKAEINKLREARRMLEGQTPEEFLASEREKMSSQTEKEQQLHRRRVSQFGGEAKETKTAFPAGSGNIEHSRSPSPFSELSRREPRERRTGGPSHESQTKQLAGQPEVWFASGADGEIEDFSDSHMSLQQLKKRRAAQKREKGQEKAAVERVRKELHERKSAKKETAGERTALRKGVTKKRVAGQGGLANEEGSQTVMSLRKGKTRKRRTNEVEVMQPSDSTKKEEGLRRFSSLSLSKSTQPSSQCPKSFKAPRFRS
uniref:Transmembrane protein n=1 Tax=Chromera velia CCMP2878 TaxID=1169474 RepID=A0A0G4HSA8_9ALVE|eukprot:Cvel_30986.t1-p1 / transcript=Cvel_30986.t1 / gene=Cvel_30986 / organism=Chromera_velia_CCMP2878 / gene_product=hypothetical protein / transcript_product=hypothetical protein / location=Cvel_scaffold4525:3182-4837(+) / protein_length=552 / sequence_SO=supercontig / SO=protein_coding / is_pseudo=false